MYEIDTVTWADPDNTTVIIKLKDGRIYGTPYTTDSIFWERRDEFPVEDILPYTPPVEPIPEEQ